jgi:hypothetical protein
MRIKKILPDLFYKFSIHALWEEIKPYIYVSILYLWPLVIAGVSYMKIEWYYALSLFFGISGILWQINRWLVPLKRHIEEHNKLEGKIIFTGQPVILFHKEDKGLVKISVEIHYYNCSPRILKCLIDKEKTKIVYNNQREDETEYQTEEWLAPPYTASWFRTGNISVNEDEEGEIKAEIHIKYGVEGKGELYNFSHTIKFPVKLHKEKITEQPALTLN